MVQVGVVCLACRGSPHAGSLSLLELTDGPITTAWLLYQGLCCCCHFHQLGDFTYVTGYFSSPFPSKGEERRGARRTGDCLISESAPQEPAVTHGCHEDGEKYNNPITDMWITVLLKCFIFLKEILKRKIFTNKWTVIHCHDNIWALFSSRILMQLVLTLGRISQVTTEKWVRGWVSPAPFSPLSSCSVLIAPVVVQSLSRVQLFATPWTIALQASLSFTVSCAQTHVYWVSDAIQSSHPLTPASRALKLSQHHCTQAGPFISC